jgi:hypothetical protein
MLHPVDRDGDRAGITSLRDSAIALRTDVPPPSEAMIR